MYQINYMFLIAFIVMYLKILLQLKNKIKKSVFGITLMEVKSNIVDIQ